MEHNIFFSAIVLLFIDCATVKSCTYKHKFKCRELHEIPHATVCYEEVRKTLTATVKCNEGNLKGTEVYTCKHNKWIPQQDSSCIKDSTSTSPLTQATIIWRSTSRQPVSLITTSRHEHLLEEDTLSTLIGNSATPVITPSTPVYTFSTPVYTFSTPVYSSSKSTSTTAVTETQPVTSEAVTKDVTQDKKGPFVAAAVSVPVIVVAVIVVVVAFMVWRKRRQKPAPAGEHRYGNSLTNRSYEVPHGLDRNIYLTNLRSSESVDSEYAEISQDDSHPKEMARNVIIDRSPVDQTKFTGNYDHLKTNTVFLDKNYSHITISQTNGNVLPDATYAHNAGIGTDIKDKQMDSDNTYNVLETISKMTKTGQVIDRVQEVSCYDGDNEYNLAKTGRTESMSENKSDTYSHLNRTMQVQVDNSYSGAQSFIKVSGIFLYSDKPHDCVKQQPGKARNDYGETKGKNNIPIINKGIKKMKESESQVGDDGYEMSSITAHNYFVLEPDT